MTDKVEPVTPFTEPTPAQATVEPVTPVQDPVPAPTAPAFQIPDSVKELVGEGKKYATPEDALSALPFAQDHIVKLQDEAANLREDLAKRRAVEDVLEEINKKPTVTDPVPQDPAQLDALIEKHLTAKEHQAVQSTNIKSVVDRMTQEFGSKEKAEEVYLAKAEELGMSLTDIKTLSAKSPDAVLKLCGVSSQSSTVQKIHSNVNTEAVHQSHQQSPDAPKSVMGQSTNKADIDAWKAAAPE